MYDGNPGEIDREVRVSEASSYRESTVDGKVVNTLIRQLTLLNTYTFKVARLHF